jgi:hypothetical protein
MEIEWAVLTVSQTGTVREESWPLLIRSESLEIWVLNSSSIGV